MTSILQPDWSDISSKASLKAVLKWEIQHLLQRLSDIGEETLVMTAVVEDEEVNCQGSERGQEVMGSQSGQEVMGSQRGQGFMMLSDLQSVKTQFLDYCKACWMSETETYRDLVSGSVAVRPKHLPISGQKNQNTSRRRQQQIDISNDTTNVDVDTEIQTSSNTCDNEIPNIQESCPEEIIDTDTVKYEDQTCTASDTNGDISPTPNGRPKSRKGHAKRKRTPNKLAIHYKSQTRKSVNTIVIKTEPCNQSDLSSENQSGEIDKTGSKPSDDFDRTGNQSTEENFKTFGDQLNDNIGSSSLSINNTTEHQPRDFEINDELNEDQSSLFENSNEPLNIDASNLSTEILNKGVHNVFRRKSNNTINAYFSPTANTTGSKKCSNYDKPGPKSKKKGKRKTEHLEDSSDNGMEIKDEYISQATYDSTVFDVGESSPRASVMTVLTEDGMMKIVPSPQQKQTSIKTEPPMDGYANSTHDENEVLLSKRRRTPGKGFKAAASDEIPEITTLLDAAKLGVGRYQCPYCSLIVRDRHDLKRHLRTHTKQKPYQCQICRRKFSRRWDHENHMRRHHEEKADANFLDASQIKMVDLDETELLEKWTESLQKNNSENNCETSLSFSDGLVLQDSENECKQEVDIDQSEFQDYKIDQSDLNMGLFQTGLTSIDSDSS